VFDEEGDDASNVDEVLGWHRAPFTAEEGRGMTTVEVPRLDEKKAARFIADYFAMIALYDLNRQWIAKHGEFVWDRFPWKPRLTKEDVERLNERFAVTFGVRLEEIEAVRR
jgi:hypothetical protein